MSKNKPNPEPAKSNGIPLVIIAGVFILAIGGLAWFYNSAGTATPVKSNTNTTSPKTPQVPINSPAGATPPNMLGSPTASVTVEEFADFQCPTCAATHPAVKEVQQFYNNKIRFIFRDFPLDIPAHDKAYDAAVAAEAAGLQGSAKFWAMQDLLFSNQQSWSPKGADYKGMWKDYAQRIGLDLDKFENDMAGLAAKTRVDQDRARGRALNVNSTPSIYINNQLVPFSEMNVAGLKQLIDLELQKTAASGANSSAPAATSATPASSNANSGANANAAAPKR